MSFGRHTAEVQEIVDFVLGGNVLREPFRPDLFQDFPTRTITSLSDLDRFRDGYHPRAEIGSNISWDGILATDNTEIFEVQERDWKDGELFDRIIPAVQKEVIRIESHLKNQLRGVVPSRAIEDIVGHFDAIMTTRAVAGANRYLADKIYRVFRAFGYPCGWSGDFDRTGFLVVYSRG
jgi:hypothetical protein